MRSTAPIRRDQSGSGDPGDGRRARNALKDQFIMDCHTHFLRDDTRIMTFLNMRIAVGKAGWNKSLADKEQTIEDLKYNNYVKEIFLDSDTKIALISSAPVRYRARLVPDQRNDGASA